MKWLLIDLSYLAHRARYSLRQLETEDIPTGVLYGFFEQLYSICSAPHILSNKVAIFCDSKKSYRSIAFPQYKKKRREDKTEEEKEQIRIMHQQTRLLVREILPAIGIPTYRQVGLESDDLMAYAAKHLTEAGRKGIVVTSDGDLYQSISSHVDWYDPSRNSYITFREFKKKKGIAPDRWGEVKAIGGCSSDEVPGIKGIGEKGAISFLKGEMPQHHKKYQTITSEQGQEELERWKELVCLPHKKIRHFDLLKPVFNADEFFLFCDKYDIKSYTGPKRSLWTDFFEGGFEEKNYNGEKRKRKLL